MSGELKYYVFVWDECRALSRLSGWSLHQSVATEEKAALMVERLRLGRDLATKVLSGYTLPDPNEEEHEASALAIA